MSFLKVCLGILINITNNSKQTHLLPKRLAYLQWYAENPKLVLGLEIFFVNSDNTLILYKNKLAGIYYR